MSVLEEKFTINYSSFRLFEQASILTSEAAVLPVVGKVSLVCMLRIH